MGMPVNTLMVPEGDSIYYDRNFRNNIELHLPYLRAQTSNSRSVLDSTVAYRFENDFYGLLTALGHPAYLHWIYMRVNELKDPRQFDGKTMTLNLPLPSTIESLRSLYNTTYRIK